MLSISSVSLFLPVMAVLFMGSLYLAAWQVGAFAREVRDAFPRRKSIQKEVPCLTR